MKEVIKNKAIVGFILFMVSVAYVNSIQMKTIMHDENKIQEEIVLNQN